MFAPGFRTFRTRCACFLRLLGGVVHESHEIHEWENGRTGEGERKGMEVIGRGAGRIGGAILARVDRLRVAEGWRGGRTRGGRLFREPTLRRANRRVRQG